MAGATSQPLGSRPGHPGKGDDDGGKNPASRANPANRTERKPNEGPPETGPDHPGDADQDAAVPLRLGRSVLGNLALFTLALTLPVLIFAAFILTQYAMTERSRIEGEASDIAQTVAASIDREVAGLLAAIDVLSGSFFLETEDWVRFREQADRLLARQGIVTVVTDMAGQQLVNLRLPIGASLPRSRVTWTDQELAGSSFVTGLLTGQVTGTKQFLIVSPIRRNGSLVQILYFSIPLERLQRILQDTDIPKSYTASIVDAKGIIMARNARAEEFVGREATDDFRHNATGQRGTWSGNAADGTEVFAAYVKSRLSGFRAAVGIRFADLNAPVIRSVSLFAALGVAVIGLSVLFGLYFGRRIATPIGALAREATRLGKGEPVVMPLSTGLIEADFVSRELANASANLREREGDLREATDEMQRFAYIVSHDLRSPLVNIMGFTTELEALRQDVFLRLEALRNAGAQEHGAQERGVHQKGEAERDGELARDFDEAIGFIKTSIGKMDRLINAILRLSREGRRDFQPERVDMDALFTGIRGSLAIQADSADATVTVARLPPIISDRLALEQIFSNLVDNALKYVRPGVPGRVEITGKSQGPIVVYHVRDNGRGIDEKDSARVFDLFRRSGIQDRPGEGIGLAHVRTLVRRLGGTIVLTSKLGQGSTFTVTLPRRWSGEGQRKAA